MKRANRPIAEELPRLLEARGMSLRALAQQAHVDVSHLSKAKRGDRGKVVSGELAGRLAVALDLPFDYFIEYRQAAVATAMEADRKLCDHFYDELPVRRRRLL